MKESPFIFWLGAELDQWTPAELGGKGYQLADLSLLAYPIPRGFIVTASTLRHFWATHPELAHIWHHEPNTATAEARRALQVCHIGPEIEDPLMGAFDQLSVATVAVRSSSSREDGHTRSYAGQFETKLNVTGDHLAEALKACWISLFSDRVLAYNLKDDAVGDNLDFAVVIQEMIAPVAAGAAFTHHPTNRDTSQIHIEAVWGLGEAQVSGCVTPDTFVLRKCDLEIMEYQPAIQETMLASSISGEGGTAWQPVPPHLIAARKLTPATLTLLASTCRNLEAVMGYPCDVEWAVTEDRLYILQCRPITT